MRNPNEGLKESLRESIASCGLSAAQLELAEQYFEGEVDACSLDIGSAADIRNDLEAYKRVKKCFERLARHKEDELIKRYFDVTFQIFGTTLYGAINNFSYIDKLIPNAKKVAMWAEQASQVTWYSNRLYQNILTITKDREELREALLYTDKNSRNARLCILSAMFYDGAGEKPWNKKGLAELEKASKKGGSGSVPGKLFKLLSGGGDTGLPGFETNKYVKKYPDEFKRYTELFPSVIALVYNAGFTDAQCSMLKDYIENRAAAEPVPQDIIDMTTGVPFHEQMSKLLIGMAAINYRLSPIIYGFLKVCMCGSHMENTLDVMLSTECKGNMDREIMHWYADFVPEDMRFIKWLGTHRLRGVNYAYINLHNPYPLLAVMAEKNPDAYIEAMKNADAKVYESLAGALREGVDKAFYKEKFAPALEVAQSGMQQNVIRQIVPGADPAAAGLSEKFLLGEEPMEKLYPCERVLALDSPYANISGSVLSYRTVYGEDAFYDRCTAYLGLRGGVYTLNNFCRTENYDFSPELAGGFFGALKRGGLDVSHRLQAGCLIYDSIWSGKTDFMKMLEELFAESLSENKQETLDAFKKAPVLGRILGIRIMGENADEYKKELFSYIGESSKQVKEELIGFFAAHEEWAEDVLSVLQNSKKAGERELAATIIGQYKGAKKYSEALSGALEKEKSKKVADIIRGVLRAEGVLAGDDAESGGDGAADSAGVAERTAESYVKECHKGGRKRTMAWLYAEPMPEVHFAKKADSPGEENDISKSGHDSEAAATEAYMQAVLISYANMPVPGMNKEVFILTDTLDRQELADYMDVLFDRWMAAGAESKKKWVLYAAAIHGGAKIVPRLQHQINEWAAASRGAIAADAVKALSLNDSPTALLIVDGIARKYKFKQVRKAAQDALQFAAAQLNLTVEELADRIVPDLGFDENMERHFDYGTRSFTVRISPSLDIEVTNDAGKRLKTLPAVGKQDDEEKATEALAQFKELKKQMKATVKNQTLRLELALSLDRRWTVESWEKLFVKNPIMHRFAISLIWGYYKDNALKQTFRYMEDGTFNTADEEEYELDGDGTVGLLHPIEMETEEITAWREQLEDYEITQSVQQLDRPIYKVAEEEYGVKHLERFGGKLLNGLSLAGKLTGLGWSKGVPQDAGVYGEFYRRDADADYAVELRFSGSYIGDENDEVTVYDASFYRLEDMDKRDYKYNMKQDEKAIDLDAVSPRYFSEIVNQLTKATASSTETNEAWKEEV